MACPASGRKEGKMKLTAAEMRTIEAVICEVAKLPYAQMNTFLGSMTCNEVQALAHKFRYSAYCERNGVEYEDMTADDFEQAYLEMFAEV